MITMDRKQIIIFIITILMFALTRDFHPLYYTNQNEYYVHAFAHTHDDLLQNDSFVQTRLKHIVFSGLIEVLYKLNIVEIGTYAIQVMLEAIFYISVFLISKSIFLNIKLTSKVNINHNLNILSLAVVLLLLFCRDSGVAIASVNHLQGFFPGVLNTWRQFWQMDGFAGQGILYGYLQASEFGIFIMLAIALALRSYWRVATVTLAVAVIFHFSYSIHCGVLVLIFAVWLMRQRDYFLSLQLLCIFGFLVLPVTIYAATFLGDPFSDVANEILAVERFPHHAIPSIFWGGLFSWSTWKLIGITLGIYLSNRIKLHLLTSIMLVGTLITIVGMIYVHITLDYEIAFLFPWRASIYLVPLATTIIMAYIIVAFSNKFSTLRLFTVHVQTVIIVSFCIVLSIELFINVRSISSPAVKADPQKQLYEQIHNLTDSTDLILLPLDSVEYGQWQDARLAMQRSIYVDIKTVPMLGTEVMEWQKRVQFVEEFYKQSLARQMELCKQQDVDYFVTEQLDSTSDITPITQVDRFYLYSCE